MVKSNKKLLNERKWHPVFHNEKILIQKDFYSSETHTLLKERSCKQVAINIIVTKKAKVGLKCLGRNPPILTA